MSAKYFTRIGCATSTILALTVVAFSAGAATPTPSAGTAFSASIYASAPRGRKPVDFLPGLWKVVLNAHVWGPINKHTVHNECWGRAEPQLTKRQEAKKCRLVRTVRHGNTFIVEEECPSSNGASHVRFSRTYAGNTATESGTVKVGGITAHLKAHAKRLGRCPNKTDH